MVRRNLRVATCAFIVGILFAFSATVAFAVTATSGYLYYGPVYGYNYKNQCTVVSGSGIWANASAYSDGSGNIPTGYMGTQANLYKDDGTLYKSSEWFYNQSPCVGITITTGSTTNSGAYYSKGKTKAYLGNGYNTYNTLTSPSLNYP